MQLIFEEIDGFCAHFGRSGVRGERENIRVETVRRVFVGFFEEKIFVFERLGGLEMADEAAARFVEEACELGFDARKNSLCDLTKPGAP